MPAEQVLVCGDEMGPLGGEPGSDSLMLAGDGARAVAVSVGVEPEGVPAGVIGSEAVRRASSSCCVAQR